MLAIKNNIMAGNAARHLGKAYDSLAKSVERLASGLRINSAKDDAAGLAVRELIRADVAVLQQGSRNAQDGISMLQTMEGAMAVIDDNLIRMKELAEQAATGSYSSDQRDIMQAEFAEMASEIDRIAGATKFNNISMLNTGTGTISIHVGTTSTIDINKADMTTSATGLDITTGTGGFKATADEGVSALTDTYLTVTETDVVTDAVQLEIIFTDTNASADETTVTVNFASINGDNTFSLEDVIDAINLVSYNLSGFDEDGNAYAYGMASAEFDTDDNFYHLLLNSKESTATEVAITATASDATVDAAGLFDKTDSFTGGLDIIASGEVDAATDTGLDIGGDGSGASSALIAITEAITAKDEARAAFGYKMNRLESTIAILDIQAENLMTAESRISDVDVATEMATLTRTQVLSQAGIAMLAQANSMPQMALTLLR